MKHKDSTITFTDLKKIVVIGGGDLLATSANLFKENGFEVTAMLAPRHCHEALPLQSSTLSQYLAQADIPYHEIEDINALELDTLDALLGGPCMAICYGPAWIFSAEVIERFSFGMFNINAIPVPHYLGGAHYTWQLLNQDRQGGCIFQEITTELDRGDIIDKHSFEIAESASTPEDYFKENVRQGLIFIEQLTKKFTSNASFNRQPYQAINQDRLYLPRLRTDKQGYINWHWTVDEIISFIRGFDEPYIGAASFINQQLVRFKGVCLVELTPAMHPFAAGLIVRKTDHQFVIAARQGYFTAEQILDESGQCIKHKLKEGQRFHTPISVLDQAMGYQVKLTAEGFSDDK